MEIVPDRRKKYLFATAFVLGAALGLVFSHFSYVARAGYDPLSSGFPSVARFGDYGSWMLAFFFWPALLCSVVYIANIFMKRDLSYLRIYGWMIFALAMIQMFIYFTVG